MRARASRRSKASAWCTSQGTGWFQEQCERVWFVPTGLTRDAQPAMAAAAKKGRSIRARQPAHGEFDRAIRQFAPAFDLAHIGGRRIGLQKGPGPGAGLLSRQREGLAQEAVRRVFSSARHAI